MHNQVLGSGLMEHEKSNLYIKLTARTMKSLTMFEIS